LLDAEPACLLELRKFVSPEVVFGAGARRLAGRYAKNYGARRVLLVSDPGVVAAGWATEAARSLEEATLPFSLFTSVTANPRSEEVMAGAELYRADGCDVIVAVGGGSVIDCAKAIGIVSTNRRDIREFEGVDQVPVPMPPLLCVPTTGGTSADVSQFAIITNLAARTKIAIVSKAVVPDLSLVDPVTLTTMDPFLTACTGIDALVHAIEAFVSNAHSPLTDLHALQAVRLLCASLLPSLRAPQNLALRGQVMLGSLEAGLAFSNASLGVVHAMSHSLGGLLDLPHGECNAVLLRHVLPFNFPAARERFVAIGEAMGLKRSRLGASEGVAALMEAIDELRRAAGLEARLSLRGVRKSDVPELAEQAIHDVCAVTNPRRANRRDLEVIYEEAL
jgi:alcohol dehydrogenase class IV